MKKVLLLIALTTMICRAETLIVEERCNPVRAAFDTVGAACTVVLKGTCDIIDGVVNFGDRTVMVRQPDGAIRHYYPAGTACPATTPVNRTTVTATQYATVVQMENAQPCEQTYIYCNTRCGYYNGWVYYNGAWIPAPNRVQLCAPPTWVPIIAPVASRGYRPVWYR
ncbi:MAG: hypothetical protein MJ033_01005 [Victivallaceae bacterium]|nr:hypothetical protein [Victivallaceae bacterium]